MRQHYRQVMHVAKADVAVAIYTGVPSGSPSPGLSMTLVYIGLNAPAGLKDKGNAVDLVGGTVSHMTSVRATALPVGPGDTTNECATGVEQGRRALVCGWSSDRCFGLLLQTSPDATISELAAAMRNMRPDLVRSRAGPRLRRGNPASVSCQQIRVVNSRLADMTTTQDQRQEVISEFEFDVKVIDEDVVSQLRVTDDAGEAPRMVVNAEGSRPPMRCCLRHARAGEQMALVSYAPLRRWAGATGADPGPYSEIGPVFIHPEPCGGPVGTSGYPEELIGATHVFRAYRANGSILGGRLATGDELADEEAAGRVLSGLFANPEVAVVHARQLGAVLVIAPECLVTGLAVLSPGICQARADCAGRRGAGPGHGSGS